MRRRLRPPAPVLWAAGVMAAVIGATWYLRNLVRHGSPGWPFMTAPWGDPAPPVVERMTDSLLDRPRQTLEGRLHLYRDALAGGVVLFAAALLAPLAVRRREVVGAGLFALALVLLWASAPVTGSPDPPMHDVSLTTVSYLLPALAAAAVALALAARDRSWRGALALAALAAALAWNVRLSAEIPFERIPPPALLAGAGAAGALIGLLVPRLPAARPLAAGALAAAVAVALGATSGGWLERHAEARPYDSSRLVAWLAEDPRYRDGDAPVHFAPDMLAVLAGERLRHPLALIPADEPCTGVTERLRDGWIVIRLRPRERTLVPFTALDCLADREPAYRGRSFLAFAPEG